MAAALEIFSRSDVGSVQVEVHVLFHEGMNAIHRTPQIVGGKRSFNRLRTDFAHLVNDERVTFVYRVDPTLQFLIEAAEDVALLDRLAQRRGAKAWSNR